MLTPDELLDHANQGFQTRVTTSEAWARSGVSRLYYASFHFCRKAANDWCNPLPDDLAKNTGHHQQLIRRLKSQGKQPIIKSQLTALADMLGKALDERVDADYYLERQVGQDQYTKALRFGRAIKSKVEEIAQVLSQQQAT